MALVFRALTPRNEWGGSFSELINHCLVASEYPTLVQLTSEDLSGNQSGRLLDASVADLWASEFVLFDDGEKPLRTTVAQFDIGERRLVFIEEEMVDVAGVFSEMPQLSPFAGSVLQAVQPGSVEIDRNLSDEYASWFAGMPAVVSVGPLLYSQIKDRVRAMAEMTELSIDEAQTRLHTAVTDGSVSVVDSHGVVRLTLPRTVCRIDPDAAGRRVHREVLACVSELSLPAPLQKALRLLRLSGGGDRDWLAELELQLKEVERLRNENAGLARERDDAYLDAAEAAQDREDAYRRIKYLERVNPVQAFADADIEVDPPEVLSFSELLDYAPEQFPHLWISPDVASPASLLDERPERLAWSKSAWGALEALNDYAQAKLEGAVACDFWVYCSNTPWGLRALPTSQVAMHESEATMNEQALSEARRFVVPESVSSTGSLVMEPHIKVVKRGSAVPRIHFFDDTQGPTKKVLVGYIGPHLPISSS